MATKTAYKIKNLTIGQQGNTGTTVYAQWTALTAAVQKNVEEISLTWYYKVENSQGKDVWLKGSTDTTGKGTSRSSTYSAPSEASAVKVSVVPVLTKEGKKKATASAASASRSFAHNAPEKPNTPTFTLNGYSLKLEIRSSDQYAKRAVFYVYRDNKTKPYKTSSKIKLTTLGIARFNVTLSANHRYFVRVRLYNGSVASEYSDVADIAAIKIPTKVTGLKVTPMSQTQIRLTWTAVSGHAPTNGYEIEYATEKKYLGTSNATTTTVSNNTEYINVEVGHKYYFRVRAKNATGLTGAWSDVVVAAAAIKPNPPTTWTLASTALIDSSVVLYWVHNSADGSQPTVSQIEWSKNGESAQTINVTHSLGPDDTDFTFNRTLNISSETFGDGDILTWRVRTKGIDTAGWSDWSALREIKVYAPASLSLGVDSEVTAYPIDVEITATPETQSIVSLYLAIKARDAYDSADYMGEYQYIAAGQVVFSRNYTDIENLSTISLTPSDVNLQNNQTYDVEAIIATSAGLTATDETEFTLTVEEPEYYLDMGITVDYDSLSAALVPACYSELNEDPESDDIYDPEYLVEGIVLNIYRINYDGSFTLIEGDLENDGITVVSDPHPALDNGKYRLVAVDSTTGMMFFEDIISEDLDVKGAVLQWDAKYASYLVRDIVNEIDDPAIGDMVGGTTLKLPFNVKKNESSDMDVALVDYIGREHPVSYYGTQKGQKITLSTDVPKDYMDTLDMIRRLQVWPGDVYVRTQDGLGFWAQVEVSFDRDYDSLIMPVSIDATRVDSDRP